MAGQHPDPLSGMKFVAVSASADCDGSDWLDFFDFLCFQDEFAAGRP